MYSFSLKPYSLSKIDLATFFAPSGVRASSTWRLTADTRASSEEKIAPEAVAERSSSANSEVDGSVGSTTETVLGASRTTTDSVELSKALAVGRTVATRSTAAVTPQMAHDFAFNFFNELIDPTPFLLFVPWAISLNRGLILKGNGFMVRQLELIGKSKPA